MGFLKEISHNLTAAMLLLQTKRSGEFRHKFSKNSRINKGIPERRIWHNSFVKRKRKNFP
jgi:hypothetical protein